MLDFDTPEAEEKAKELGLPKTATVKTPRGRHYYFKHPGGNVRSRAGVIAGMDIRGEDGYRIAPIICYDIRVPELCRTLCIDQGAHLILHCGAYGIGSF